MRVLVIIPAYNEEGSIQNVVADLEKEKIDCDYIVINDCSTDNTGKILDENNISHIDLPVNLGLSGAVQTGYKYAYYKGYDAALQFDGDGQHLPNYIPEMIKQIEEGNDIVIGSRFVQYRRHFSLRMLGSRIITYTMWLTTGQHINDPTSGMRMINRKLIKDYAFHMNRQPEPDTLAYQIKKGYKVKEIQVEMADRVTGSSIYTGLGSSIKYMSKVVVTILFFN